MRVGIVGPLGIVDKFILIIKHEFPQIEPVKFLYKEYAEVPGLIAGPQSHLDAILFAGATPLSYAEKHVKQLIPWEFVPRSGSSLLRVLLQIALSKKYDIRRLSTDLYDVEQLSETYEEIGIAKSDFQIYTVNKTPIDDEYIDYVCAFHEQHFLCNQVSCCITALSTVHERLKAKNIPCFLVDPTANVIRQTLHKMQLNHLAQVSQQSQIVAICVRIDFPDEYSLFRDSEYQYNIAKTNVARHIYLFAQRVQAATIEVGAREFLLFSTRQLLESVTENYEKIDLLEAVRKNTANTISLGVGYGQTAQEAKASAGLGMERASKLGGNTAFIVYNRNKTIGPIRTGEETRQKSPNRKIDGNLLAISEKSDLSINTIFQLHSILERQGKTRFTAAELASLAGVTPRTMNRILAKLALHGFCIEVGRRVLTKGRPSRIIELSIP
ncbi:hypothetical protein [Anaeroselena agilis]|uniref:Helix-turn-helix domain-containing protein n=1 Tax=Anaeroselena agilis TaxID=3063788 RepID=A0ABU3P0P4_9FIRM|nr:helix-turn-helix domain-containing protein [Selenomonadales bacterium 4137-cl]